MTEEEKKAIEYLEAYIKNDKEDIKILNNTIDEDIDYYTEVEPIQKRVKYLETIKNLIEKLQKENEELKNKVIKRDNEIIELEETSEKEFMTKQEVKENYIPKGKIREKIEELEKAGTTETRNNKNEVVERHYFLQDEIDILTELLEEE